MNLFSENSFFPCFVFGKRDILASFLYIRKNVMWFFWNFRQWVWWKSVGSGVPFTRLNQSDNINTCVSFRFIVWEKDGNYFKVFVFQNRRLCTIFNNKQILGTNKSESNFNINIPPPLPLIPVFTLKYNMLFHHQPIVMKFSFEIKMHVKKRHL